MNRIDSIAYVEIDSEGSLHVKPRLAAFPFIWREALEVHWDSDRASLYAPPPRSWSYEQWFGHVLDAARNQGWTSEVDEDTEWVNVIPTLERAFRRIGERET